VTQDEYGEEIETWAEVFKEWARTFYGKGNERRLIVPKCRSPFPFWQT